LAFVPTLDADGTVIAEDVLYKEIWIDNTIDVKFTDPTQECKFNYKLQVKWDGDYMPWDDAVPLMKAATSTN
jgi:hypothetical protein